MMLRCLVALAVCVLGVVSQTCKNVVTYNTGLTPHISNYEARAEAIPEALLDEGAHVYCLQEYWLESDLEELLDAVDHAYPHHYSYLHNQLDELRPKLSWWEKWWDFPDAACGLADIFHFITSIRPCALANDCHTAFYEAAEAGVQCLAQNCAEQLKDEGIRADCVSCIILLDLAGSSFTSIVFDCANPSYFRPHNRFNSPGLVLLSKVPLNYAQYVSYFPANDMSIQRGYLEAEISGVGVVHCTHLSSANKYYFEYDLSFESYEAQQQEEIQSAYYYFGGYNHIFLGDMNTGPEVVDNDSPEKNLSGEVPANYDLFLSLGYQSPYMDQVGRCTYCADNPLVNYNNKAIDHVFIEGDMFSSVTTSRVLDKTTPLALSDHYGVKAKVCVP